MSDGLDNVLLFSGSAHPELTQEVAAYLDMTVSPTKITKFSNDNFGVQLGATVRRKDVFILQPLVPPTSDHLLELLLMLDIARTSGAFKTHAVIPHYSYARSDKKDAPRISIAGRLVADLLGAAGAEHVITMTLHSPQVHGFFRVHTDHLTAYSVFVDYFKKKPIGDCVVVSPDIGYAKRAGKLARALGLPMAVGQKERLSDHEVEFTDILGDVKGKHILIAEDEIATGGTIIELVHTLRAAGAGPITVTCTHGLFTRNAAERLNAIDGIDEIVTTNTVPVPPERQPERLVQLSIGHILGEVIRCNILGKSVGQLFAFWPQT